MNNIKELLVKKNINKTILFKIGSGFLIFILLLSIFRVPYIGVFFDSIFFSFWFGFSKYVIYLYSIIILFLFIINKKKKVLYSKRTIICILLTSLFISLLLSSIQSFNSSETLNPFIQSYIKYWTDYIFNFNNYWVFGNINYIDGGIFAVLLNSISNFFIMLVAICSLFAVYLWMFSKHRNILFSKIKKTIYKKKNNANDILIDKEENQTVIRKTENENIYLNTLLDPKINLEEKFDKIKTKNDFDEEEITKKMIAFFNDNNIDYDNFKKNINDDIVTFSFLIDDNNYVLFKSVFDTFKLNINLPISSISFQNNELLIAISYNNQIKNNILKKLLLAKLSKPLSFCFCLSKNYQPIILDLRKNNFINIFDQNNKNIVNLINNIICSLTWNYNPKNMEIVYLSPKNIELSILQTQLCTKVKNFDSPTNIFSYLKDLENEMVSIKKTLEKNNLNNIYEYNSISTNFIKNKILLINNINQLIEMDANIIDTIQSIYKMSKECGVTIITFDNSINGISNSSFKCDFKCIFKSDDTLSNNILLDNSAVKLEDTNNGILLSTIKKEKYFFYIPWINDIELEVLIKFMLNNK